MSIESAFDKDGEGIVNPHYAKKGIDGFPEKVIVVFVEEFTDVLLKSVDSEVITYMSAGSMVPIYQFTYENQKIGFYQSMIGGAAAGAMLDEVIAMGAKKFLFFGSCGSLEGSITSGHLIVPTAAYRDEGFSYHYVPAGDYIEITTAKRMAELLHEIQVPYIETKTWTTDAIYRETRRNMNLRKEEGCAVVEMECASIMAVGQFRHAEVYQFLFAADCLDGEEWDKRILSEVPLDMKNSIVHVALKAVTKL